LLTANVTLPLGFTRQASDPITSGLITATSVTNSAKFNSTWIDLQNNVTGGGVDIVNLDTNGNEIGAGNNPTNGGNPWTTIGADRGSSVRFMLRVKNTGLRPDSFALSFTSVPNPLPTGWRVVFKDSASGSILVNTGIIAGGASKDFYAEVTIPADATPQNLDLTFQAASATNTSVTDTKLDRVSVNSFVDIGITPNVTRQIEVNGVKDFGHKLENYGNVAITDGAIGYRKPFVQFSVGGGVFIDLNANGELDPNEQSLGPVTSIAQILQKVPSLGTALAPGASVYLVVRVSAPGGLAPGYTEVAELEVATALTSPGNTAVTDANPANNMVTETAVISSGIIRAEKFQALDANCDGTPEGSYDKTPLNADPGACILYEVRAENISAGAADNVTILDATPNFTTIKSTPAALAPVATTNGTAATVTAPADGTAGDVRSTHGTLQPGGLATLKFTVRIDN